MEDQIMDETTGDQEPNRDRLNTDQAYRTIDEYMEEQWDTSEK
jgi:hypothetical protein